MVINWVAVMVCAVMMLFFPGSIDRNLVTPCRSSGPMGGGGDAATPGPSNSMHISLPLVVKLLANLRFTVV